MKLRLEIDDELVAKIDELVGRRGRSQFVADAVEVALDWNRRWDLIEGATGSISDHEHEWDADPAEWVRQQRRSDPRRIG